MGKMFATKQKGKNMKTNIKNRIGGRGMVNDLHGCKIPLFYNKVGQY